MDIELNVSEVIWYLLDTYVRYDLKYKIYRGCLLKKLEKIQTKKKMIQ